jgi:hypothetical protein
MCTDVTADVFTLEDAWYIVTVCKTEYLLIFSWSYTDLKE